MSNETQVEMRYKPERALTHSSSSGSGSGSGFVEMRYKPERALTPIIIGISTHKSNNSRNEI